MNNNIKNYNNNNENIQVNKPIIFTKKVNDKHKVIPLNITSNTLGPTRYFLPATKEWFNSIYAYNNNSLKNLSVADKNLSKLIKSYFNLYFNKKVLKSKPIATRFRRLAINKIFISKAELKHTSSKVVISLHVYNEERRVLVRKLKRLEILLFPSFYLLSRNENKNRALSLEEKLSIIKNQENKVSLIKWLEGLRSSIFEQIKLEGEILLTTKKLKLKKEKLLIIKNLERSLENLVNIIFKCENDSVSFKHYENIYSEFLRKRYLEKEIMTIAYYKLLLSLNKYKFEDKFILKLKPLISKIYNKKVELNIINLKTLYLNSNIFTQAVSLKLKNRDNKLLNVLRSSLYMIKLPIVNRIKEKFNKTNIKELWINRVNNLKINSIINKYRNNQDTLNQLLLDFFPSSSSFIKKEEEERSKNKFNTSSLLISFVLNSIKHKEMAGARLEAKGRLTRRFTASRSVFKIKWKGSLKNIDSSYRGLSSVILRGYAKSNVQYSIINSKNRNGAFGLKGWISNK